MLIEDVLAGGGVQGAECASSSQGPRDIELSIVDTLTAFEDLRPEWDALMAAAGTPDQVFQQHAWLWHWWRTYLGDSRAPIIVIGRRQGRLTLIIPLVAETKFGVRTLSWMGDPVSQYSDILTDGKCIRSDEILRGLEFAAQCCGGHLLAAGNVRQGSALAAALEAGGGRVSGEQIAPAISLHEMTGLEDIEARFSSKMRRNRRRYRKLLEASGRLVFRVVSEGPEALAAVESALCSERRLQAALRGPFRDRARLCAAFDRHWTGL